MTGTKIIQSLNSASKKRKSTTFTGESNNGLSKYPKKETNESVAVKKSQNDAEAEAVLDAEDAKTKKTEAAKKSQDDAEAEDERSKQRKMQPMRRVRRQRLRRLIHKRGSRGMQTLRSHRRRQILRTQRL